MSTGNEDPKDKIVGRWTYNYRGRTKMCASRANDKIYNSECHNVSKITRTVHYFVCFVAIKLYVQMPVLGKIK